MPRTISKFAQDFILRLLHKDPKKRLGGGPRGIDEIKTHAIFQVGIFFINFKFVLKFIFYRFRYWKLQTEKTYVATKKNIMPQIFSRLKGVVRQI